VHLKQAPSGWTFTPETDGFTVAGPALPVGTDAVWSVTIDKLPADAAELLFKTIETYGDGEIVRWIDEPQAGPARAGSIPAPSVKLAPAARVARPVPTPSATVASTPAPSVVSVDEAPAPPLSSDGGWRDLVAGRRAGRGGGGRDPRRSSSSAAAGRPSRPRPSRRRPDPP
jgi:hypothetical protein